MLSRLRHPGAVVPLAVLLLTSGSGWTPALATTPAGDLAPPALLESALGLRAGLATATGALPTDSRPAAEPAGLDPPDPPPRRAARDMTCAPPAPAPVHLFPLPRPPPAS